MNRGLLDNVSGLTLDELNQRQGVMGPLAPDEEQDHTSEQNDVEGKIGPCDIYSMPLRYAYRRAYSDLELIDALGSLEFKEGMCYNFLSRGDVDLASYLRMMLRVQDIDELIVSSWRADLSDVEMLCNWKRQGRIGKLDVYLGRLYAYGSERRYNVHTFREMLQEFPDASVKVFRNHTKLIVGKGKNFNFVIQASANLNTNVNAENACLIIDRGCWDFYRGFFSDIKSLI